MSADIRWHLRGQVETAIIKNASAYPATFQRVQLPAERRVLNRGFYNAIVGALKCLP